MVRIHLFTYAAFLVSVFLFFSALINAPKTFVIVFTILFSVASFTSQLGLVYIFNQMCFQHEKHQKEFEVQFKRERLESLNSISETEQTSEDLAYRESLDKLTASLKPLDT